MDMDMDRVDIVAPHLHVNKDQTFPEYLYGSKSE